MASKPCSFVDTSIGRLAVFKFTWRCYKLISKDLSEEIDSYKLLRKLIPYICCPKSFLREYGPCSENVVLKEDEVERLTIEDLEKIAKTILEHNQELYKKVITKRDKKGVIIFKLTDEIEILKKESETHIEYLHRVLLENQIKLQKKVKKSYLAFSKNVIEIVSKMRFGSNPYQQVISNIDKYFLKNYQNYLSNHNYYEKYIDINQYLQNAIKQLYSHYPDFLENIQNMIFENLIGQKNLIDKIDICYQWQNSLEKYLQEISSTIKNQYFDLNLRFQINDDGTITIEEEIYSKTKVKENIDKISKELACSTSWNEFIEKLKELLGSPYKIIRFLAITIFWIISFLGNFVNIADYFDVTYSDLKNLISENFFCSEQINASKRDFKLKLRKTIIKAGLDIPSYYRFVIANILYVRNGPSRKSEIIDELPRGKIVKLVAKKRRWCLVQYEDEDTGEIKEGWVFLRYLERFKK